ncbi:MAG TPA: hypothetical protein VK604_10075 [Bryobacteraceae bacterium]|nr:hypothetical protein [Bryobacteraceae bacterium]
MENSRIDAVGLLLALVAVVMAFSAGQANFGYVSSLAGLSLLLILFAYDRKGYRSGAQSLAFAAVCGICLMLACGYLLRLVSSSSKPDRLVFEEWLGFLWLGGTIVFWGIDRARMGSREQSGFPSPALVARPAAQGGFISQATVYPAPFQPPAPQPVPYTPPAPEPQPVFRQPEPASPVTPAPEAPPLPVEPVNPPPIPSNPPPIPAAPRVLIPPIPPGRETTIYVNLLGETMNVLRTVHAENLGRDFYRIVDDMPDGEHWEFKPGQVVRCKKKNLSSGKGLVAFEEAPRAN